MIKVNRIAMKLQKNVKMISKCYTLNNLDNFLIVTIPINGEK